MNKFRNAILAGICIGIGSFVNMKIGGIYGAILFAFGLLVVIKEKYNLFTGIAGWTTNIKDLSVSLLGNFIGACAVGQIGKYCSPFDMTSAAETLITGRISTGVVQCFFLAMMCGFIVTVSVKHARNESYAPLFIGVPLFIMAGFPHCIADIFPLTAVSFDYMGEHWLDMLKVWLAIILGNYVGCNLYRIKKEG
jgi:formate/nitrite transporter FocA (FNT family)